MAEKPTVSRSTSVRRHTDDVVEEHTKRAPIARREAERDSLRRVRKGRAHLARREDLDAVDRERDARRSSAEDLLVRHLRPFVRGERAERAELLVRAAAVPGLARFVEPSAVQLHLPIDLLRRKRGLEAALCLDDEHLRLLAEAGLEDVQ